MDLQLCLLLTISAATNASWRQTTQWKRLGESQSAACPRGWLATTDSSCGGCGNAPTAEQRGNNRKRRGGRKKKGNNTPATNQRAASTETLPSLLRTLHSQPAGATDAALHCPPTPVHKAGTPLAEFHRARTDTVAVSDARAGADVITRKLADLSVVFENRPRTHSGAASSSSATPVWAPSTTFETVVQTVLAPKDNEIERESVQADFRTPLTENAIQEWIARGHWLAGKWCENMNCHASLYLQAQDPGWRGQLFLTYLEYVNTWGNGHEHCSVEGMHAFARRMHTASRERRREQVGWRYSDDQAAQTK